jgi:hypothetical protein
MPVEAVEFAEVAGDEVRCDKGAGHQDAVPVDIE